MKIKGSFLTDYVEIVKNTPELDWDKYLTESDWAVVRGGFIIPTQWYPVEIMAHIGRGIFHMRSNENYEVVRLHGRSRVNQIFGEATKNFLTKNDPVSSIKAYTAMAGRYLDEMDIVLEGSSSDSVNIAFFPVDGAPAWDLFREIQAGTIEELVELNGGKNARADFAAFDRQGREGCIIAVKWK